MPITVPDNPRVYTTKYANFRGVDFTNDQTNIWYRRSPTGTNMLPDESGRPFKRHGWSVLLSNADISQVLGVESCTIYKCSYFELAGVDHIVVFTDEGVLFYADPDGDGEGEATDISTDYDCYTGYDRSFFFEGNGIAAFYIYGNFKVWRYESDFQLHDVTGKITVPTVLIGAGADGTGTFYEGYNLLGTKAAVEYNDCTLFTYWCSDGISIAVDDIAFKEGKTPNTVDVYKWRWDGTDWAIISGGLAFPSAQITVSGTKSVNDEITVLYIYGVMLPNNVSQSQIEDVTVKVSKSVQFDLPLAVKNDTDTQPTSAECRLFDDDTLHRENKRAWIQFDHAWEEIVQGEDFIRVEFPSVNINITEYPIAGHETDCQNIGTASLVGV